MGCKSDIRDRICLPLDVDNLTEAEALVQELLPFVGYFKIGFQLFLAEGPKAVEKVHQLGGCVFLDLKFHDIPNTVQSASRMATRLGVSMFNLHASGGETMIREAVEASKEEAHKAGVPTPVVLAVTVLTSLSDQDLQNVLGIHDSVQHSVIRLAKFAKSAGAGGIIASPHEAAVLRQSCGKDFLLVTPGVRPAGAASSDQKRVMTPGEAIKAGADILVIGRPILRAHDRSAAAASILEEVRNAEQEVSNNS